jgi:hypothetical protein
MKADGFVKVMLVAIAGLLAWSCARDLGADNGERRTSSVSLEGTAAHADPPPGFIQVGKFYRFFHELSGNMGPVWTDGEVLNIDRECGWVRIRHLADCVEAQAELRWNDGFYKRRGCSWINLNQVLSCFELEGIKKISSQPK